MGEKKYKIYLIINKINGKTYVGMTSRTVKQRVEGGHFTKNANILLQRALDKYGKDNFEYGTLEVCGCEEDAVEAEKFWIATFNSISNGYNIDEGGTFPSESMRDKSSEGLREYWKRVTGKKSVKRINIKKINELTQKYVDTKDEKIWDDLISELYIIIDILLGKNYTRIKTLWDDMRQDVIINLWKNRRTVGDTCSHSFYNHYYNRIRKGLNRAIKKYEGEKYEESDYLIYKEKKQPMYDFLDMNVKSIEDLTDEEKLEVGLDTEGNMSEDYEE